MICILSRKLIQFLAGTAITSFYNYFLILSLLLGQILLSGICVPWLACEAVRLRRQDTVVSLYHCIHPELTQCSHTAAGCSRSSQHWNEFESWQNIFLPPALAAVSSVHVWGHWRYIAVPAPGPDTLPHNIHGWDGIKTYHLHLHLTCYIHNPICCTIPICRHQYFVSMESLSQNGEFPKVMCCSSLEACSGLKSHFSVQL